MALRTYGDLRGVGVSYERGAPVSSTLTRPPRGVRARHTRTLQGYLAHKKLINETTRDWDAEEEAVLPHSPWSRVEGKS